MSQLELRNLATDENVIVPPGGLTFGRKGGDADVQLADPSVARRQSRLSLREGEWVLDVLAGPKLAPPMSLEEGMTFSVGRTTFEVLGTVHIENKPTLVKSPMPSKPALDAKTKPLAESFQRPTPPPPRAPSKPVTPRVNAARPPDPDEAQGGIAGLFVGVPKGIAYYLLNVPKMLVNPLGTVRGAIEEQPAEPMGRADLIGFALPAMLASALLGSIASGIAVLIAGGGFQLMSFLPIVPAVGAVIGAVITGFVFHPVLTWVISKLKGSSTARSRSNYFLQLMTLTIVLALPNALGAVLSSIRFLNLVGVLLLAVGSLVFMYALYKWLEHFEVATWVLTVVKVLSLLTLLGGFGNFGNALMGSIRGGGAAVATPVITTTDVAAAVPTTNPTDAEPANVEAPEEAARARAPVEAAPVEAAAPQQRAVVAAGPPSGTFTAFAQRRAAMEAAFAADPTVFTQKPELKELYAAYLSEASRIDKSYAEQRAAHPDQLALYEYLKQADLYVALDDHVRAIAKLVGVP